MRHLFTSRRLAVAAAVAGLAAAPFAAGLSLAPTPSIAQSALVAPGPSFADLVAETKPAVVTVSTVVTGGGAGGLPGLEGPMREFMERFFQREDMPFPAPRERRRSGVGSGFVISADGLIVTNNHVIQNADRVTVTFDDGSEAVASVIGTDDKTDLAVLQVETDQSLPFISFGDSDVLRVGDWVVAIGNPFGLGGTVTAGIVSARGRDINSGPYDDFIQVDAAINRGNSGGPLIDLAGNVMGVNTAIFSPNGGNIGLGFAIPANQARNIIDQLIDSGSVERGLIGVAIQTVTPEIADGLGLDRPAGALVASVAPGGPADAAGVRPRDVIIGFGGSEIEEVRDLTRAVADTKPGVERELQIWRGGRSETLSLTVAAMDAEPQPAAFTPPSFDDLDVPAVGLALQDGSGFGAEVAEVAPDSPADAVGLRVGDVILGVGDSEVANAAEAAALLRAAVDRRDRAILLLVQREGRERFVALTL